MSRLPLRERKKLQTRDDFIRAAVELFEENGYEATTVDDIVERANYSRATFFRYFGAKEDVVFLDIAERIHGFVERLYAPLPGETPRQTAEHALGEQILDNFSQFGTATVDNQSDLDLLRACMQLWFTEPSLTRRYREIVAEWEAHLTEFFQEAMEVDTLEAMVHAIMVIGVGRAVMETHLHTNEDFDSLIARGYAAAEGKSLQKTARRTRRR